MKIIDLSSNKFPNKFTVVDDDDYPHLCGYKWHPVKRGDWFYAARNKKAGDDDNLGGCVYMHRVILNNPPNMEIDHADGDGLNNTKENLRACDHFGNMRNKRKSPGKTSPYRGVCWSKKGKKFIAQIQKFVKTRTLGYFADEVEAAKAYDKAALSEFGVFAKLNFPSLAQQQNETGK